jgi:apolipoprotein N-acyltransferase
MYAEATGRFRYATEDAVTPYAEYGDWFAWGFLLVAAALLVISQRPIYAANAPEVRKVRAKKS